MKDNKCLICRMPISILKETTNLYECRDSFLIMTGIGCEDCKNQHAGKLRSPYSFGKIVYNKEVEEIQPEDLQAVAEFFDRRVKHGKRRIQTTER